MKKLGIIGGMGPFADQAFLSLLNSLTNGTGDQDHIPFLLDGNCARPDRSDFICKKSKLSPFLSLSSSADMLARCGCDCIAMPCNTAHFWYCKIKKRLPQCIDFPSIISLSVNSCAKKSNSALLLSTDGTRLCGLYSRECALRGLTLPLASEKLISMTRNIILSVKSGENTDISELLYESSKYCDSVILACTELSAALMTSTELPKNMTITDSLSVLARYVAEKYFKKPFNLPYT